MKIGWGKREVQLLKSTDLGRHSLLYLKEIGHGWFGKVLLGEVNSGLSAMQVVVRELKASASVQDQMQFLEEAQPYRTLQHPALLQCLAQCTEVTPYLLVMEFCPLGDLKGYLLSCRASDSMTPDPLMLQRMACEITSGLLHLHKHNFIHSDLALRNCLLTAEATVKIGDYGLSQNKYKEDYFVTSDQLWVPLRWIAPELVDEVHGNLLVVDQTKPGNIWSLGVTVWELFELGNQPYRQYSDRQVLTYAVKEQQLKLTKPLLKVPLSDRWYEVMQFCWLQPDQRPTAEEVHLLLSYLCAKGASEAEEDFEKRWNSMRPNNSHCAGLAGGLPPSCSSSSFPLLERFSVADSYQPEPGDDVLTVTETRHGLNFEYKWEQARHELPYRSSSTSGPLGQGNPHYQDIYYPSVGSCGADGLTLGVSPSYYDSKQLHTPGVVPVLSAHSPSMSSEYYIRIEEPVDCHIDRNYTVCPYSPGFEGSADGDFVVGSGEPVGCINCPSEAQPSSFWSTDVHKASAYDSDNSPAISLTMEPLLGQVCSPMQPWESGHYVSYKDRDGGYYYDPSPSMEMDHYLMEDNMEPQEESWGSRSLRQALGELENPLGISPSLSDPRQGYGDPCMAGECYYDMMGSLRKTMPRPHSVSIGPEGPLFRDRRDSDLEEDDLFVEREARSWASNHSANNNSLNFSRRPVRCSQDTYVDYHYTMPSTDVEDLWPQMDIKEKSMFRSNNPLCYPEPMRNNAGRLTLSKHHSLINPRECNICVYPCHKDREDPVSPDRYCQTMDDPQSVDPLSGTLVRNYGINNYIREKKTEPLHAVKAKNLSTLPTSLIGEYVLSKSQMSDMNRTPILLEHSEHQTGLGGEILGKIGNEQEVSSPTDVKFMIPTVHIGTEKPISPDPVSDSSQLADSGVERGCSSISLVDIDDCSDEDITDVTSGIFVDFIMDYVDSGNAPAALKNPQDPAETPDSVDSIDLPSTAGSCDALSPASFDTSSPPKAHDSGYDTENNESPEFVMKEPLEPRDPEGFSQSLGKTSLCGNLAPGVTEAKVVLQAKMDDSAIPVVSMTNSTELDLTSLCEKNPYRDSAYFSDYDAENERFSQDKEDNLLDKLDSDDLVQKEDGDKSPRKLMEKENLKPLQLENDKGDWKNNEEDHSEIDVDVKKLSPQREFSETKVCGSSSGPMFSMLSPSPPEMGGCLTKESSQDEGLGLDSENPVEEASSESSSSTVSEGTSVQQQPSTSGVGGKESEGADDSPAEPLISDSASTDGNTEMPAESNDDKTDPVECGHLQEEENGQDNVCSRSINEDQEAQATDTESDGLMNIPKCPSSPPPPLPPIESRISPGDGEEADSEDSEESDEELRCYNVQEQNEESEEESSTVPVVVSDCSDACHLRSLLKLPTLLTESLSDEFDRKKKAVSFFDDVTVFLFDQESPTRELAEDGFPPGAESCGQGLGATEPHPQEKVNATSDESSDGNISEESAGFEWEDDFPLLPNASSVVATRSTPEKPSAPRQSADPSEPKPAMQFSRFTVSPSLVSRFSITHVSDSDIESAGGSSEDGERE